MRIVLLIFAALVTHAHSIRFYLEPNSVKCLKEETQPRVLVAGEYEVSEVPGIKTEFIIRDSRQEVLSKNDNVPHGKPLKFTFALEMADRFEICFMAHAIQPNSFSANMKQPRQEVHLVSKRGIEAKNYDGISEVAKLKPSELELKRLEDLSEAVVQDFALMQKNEKEMRDTNEATNTRVFHFSIFSSLWLLILSVCQLLYLRRFFKLKKLIE